MEQRLDRGHRSEHHLEHELLGGLAAQSLGVDVDTVCGGRGLCGRCQVTCSEGEFANTSFSTNVDDLVAACRYLDDRGMPPKLLIGHSLGGSAVLKAAPQLAPVKAVVTLGAPFDPHHVTHSFADALPEIMAKGVAEVSLGGRPFRIGKSFLDDVARGELTPAISTLNAALLVMHAPLDATVSIDNASEIFLAAKHPKSFVTLDDADHLITRARDAEYAADVIATWARRYISLTPPAPPPGAPGRSDVCVGRGRCAQCDVSVSWRRRSACSARRIPIRSAG